MRYALLTSTAATAATAIARTQHDHLPRFQDSPTGLLLRAAVLEYDKRSEQMRSTLRGPAAALVHDPSVVCVRHSSKTVKATAAPLRKRKKHSISTTWASPGFLDSTGAVVVIAAMLHVTEVLMLTFTFYVFQSVVFEISGSCTTQVLIMYCLNLYCSNL
jgi:hypothetical protein